MQEGLIAENKLIRIRKTLENDIPFVLQQEAHPDNAPFVGQWTEPQHRAALQDPDCGHWIIEVRGTGKPAGYVILRGLQNPHSSMEFMRIVISEKKNGLGRETLRLVKRIAFEQLQTHRLWLDVRDFNVRAQNLYRSEGFVQEGVLRECRKQEDRYSSLIVMSMLEPEWHERNQAIQ
jgi:RimJ/RimL family protein N-acetyltransferase